MYMYTSSHSSRVMYSPQLNLTHDPIADMINAVCSDIVSFASQRT